MLAWLGLRRCLCAQRISTGGCAYMDTWLHGPPKYSGRIGEDPSGIPNNLMPYVSQVCPCDTLSSLPTMTLLLISFCLPSLVNTTGGRGPAPAPDGVREQLQDQGRHGRARLHPRDGPGGGPPGRPRLRQGPRAPGRALRVQPRHVMSYVLSSCSCCMSSSACLLTCLSGPSVRHTTFQARGRGTRCWRW